MVLGIVVAACIVGTVHADLPARLNPKQDTVDVVIVQIKARAPDAELTIGVPSNEITRLIEVAVCGLEDVCACDGSGRAVHALVASLELMRSVRAGSVAW